MKIMDAGTAWGYPFDTQTRHLYYDRTTPNAVATSFVVQGLLDAHEAGHPTAADLALAARPFLLSLLTPSTHGPFFAYVADGSELIHNANLLVCAALARTHELEPNQEIELKSRAAAQTTISRQRLDGLWDYGEARNLRWIDNFHTAYILESLTDLETVFGIGSSALNRGLPAWRSAFIEPDGWARYFPAAHYPLEMHSAASAIDLCCRWHRRDPSAESIEDARRIAEAVFRELWMTSENRYAYRRTANRTNRRLFMRWTNAPMFRALARLTSEDT